MESSDLCIKSESASESVQLIDDEQRHCQLINDFIIDEKDDLMSTTKSTTVPNTVVQDTSVPEAVVSDTVVPDTMVPVTILLDTAHLVLPDIAVHRAATDDEHNVRKRKHRNWTDEYPGKKTSRINDLDGADMEIAVGAENVDPPALEAETMETDEKLTDLISAPALDTEVTEVAKVAVAMETAVKEASTESVRESVAMEVIDKPVTMETDKYTAMLVQPRDDVDHVADTEHNIQTSSDSQLAGGRPLEGLSLVTTQTENQSLVTNTTETASQSLVTAETTIESLVVMEMQSKQVTVAETGDACHSVTELETLSRLVQSPNVRSQLNNTMCGDNTEQCTTLSTVSTLSTMLTSAASPINSQSTLPDVVSLMPILRPILAEIQLSTSTAAAGTLRTAGSTTAHSPDQTERCKSSHHSTGAVGVPVVSLVTSSCEGDINIAVSVGASALGASNVISTTTPTTCYTGAVNTDTSSCTGGINAQLLSLPRSIVDCRNLSRPLTLRFHGRQVIVPPSCVILTSDGAKLLLPPHTLSAPPAVQGVKHTGVQEPIDYSCHTRSDLPVDIYNTCILGSSTIGNLDAQPAQLCNGVGAVQKQNTDVVFDKTDVSHMDEFIDSKIKFGVIGVKSEVDCDAGTDSDTPVATTQPLYRLSVEQESTIDCRMDECKDLSAGAGVTRSGTDCEVTGVIAECSVETGNNKADVVEAAGDVVRCMETVDEVDSEETNAAVRQDETTMATACPTAGTCTDELQDVAETDSNAVFLNDEGTDVCDTQCEASLVAVENVNIVQDTETIAAEADSVASDSNANE